MIGGDGECDGAKAPSTLPPPPLPLFPSPNPLLHIMLFLNNITTPTMIITTLYAFIYTNRAIIQ
jgi:hypothetical protein